MRRRAHRRARAAGRRRGPDSRECPGCRGERKREIRSMTDQKTQETRRTGRSQPARLLAGLGRGGGHGRADRPGGPGILDEAQAAQAEPKVLSGTVEITLKVNGQDRSCSVEPRSTLLDTLRNRLDVTGPKRVCDRGELRRLHGDRRRRAGLFLHHAGRLVPGQDDRDAGELRHRRARRAPRVPPERRPDVRLLHARLRHRVQGVPRQATRTRPLTRSARGSTATSAAAAPTSASWQAALAAAKAMKGA